MSWGKPMRCNVFSRSVTRKNPCQSQGRMHANTSSKPCDDAAACARLAAWPRWPPEPSPESLGRGREGNMRVAARRHKKLVQPARHHARLDRSTRRGARAPRPVLPVHPRPRSPSRCAGRQLVTSQALVGSTLMGTTWSMLKSSGRWIAWPQSQQVQPRLRIAHCRARCSRRPPHPVAWCA